MTTLAEIRAFKLARLERYQDSGTMTISDEDQRELFEELDGLGVPGVKFRDGKVVRALGVEIVTA